MRNKKAILKHTFNTFVYTVITYNNILIGYRCIPRVHDKNFRTSRRMGWTIWYKSIRHTWIAMSNKALISDGWSENLVLINTINWLYYIYIYILSYFCAFFPSYRLEKCSRQIEAIQAYYETSPSLYVFLCLWSGQTIQKRR